MSPRSISRAGTAATIAAVLVVIAGLFTLGTPSHARERKLDRLRIDDLSMLSGAIDGYWAKNGTLPDSLHRLVVSRQFDHLPSDPQTHESYTYLASGERSYRLCATFARASDSTDASAYGNGDITFVDGRYDGGHVTREPHSWRHGAGESCFDLTPPSKESK